MTVLREIRGLVEIPARDLKQDYVAEVLVLGPRSWRSTVSEADGLGPRSAGTQRLVGLPGVHIGGRGPIDGHGTNPVGMRIKDLPRRLVPSERLQAWEQRPGEDERMAWTAAVRGARDGRGLATPGLDHRIDHRRLDARLVTQHDGHRVGSGVDRPEPRATGSCAALTEFRVLDHGGTGEVHLATHRARCCADDHDALVESMRGTDLRHHVAEQGSGSEGQELLRLAQPRGGAGGEYQAGDEGPRHLGGYRSGAASNLVLQPPQQ